MSNTFQLSDRNTQILSALEKAYNEKPGPRIGDFLQLPYGMYTRFTHFWNDSIQTGLGSFHLGKGYMDYSGSLNEGIASNDIVATNERKPGSVWIWNEGIVGAGRGIDCEMLFRVFAIKVGSNTSGIPQIKQYELDKFLETVEKITRINGNGQPYTLPVPVLRLQFGPSISDKQRLSIVAKASEATGLNFELTFHYSKAQPVTVAQVEALKRAFPGYYEFHNGCYFKNTLVFEFK